MPRLVTVCIAILLTSLSLTGMMMARENPEWLTYDFWFSDGRIKLEIQYEKEDWCEASDFTVRLDNTSTTGGGPVPMTGASQTIKIPIFAFGALTVANIIADKGTISISNDGTYYTVVNNIGDVAPNDIFAMHFSPLNTYFYSSLALEGFISSSTFDPDESNNETMLSADFNFNIPATYGLSLLSGNATMLDSEYDYQVTNPNEGLSMRFSIDYDGDGCTMPFWNGKFTLKVPSLFGDPTVEESSDGASSSTDGDYTMIQTDPKDFQPGETFYVDVSWDDIPLINQVYDYSLTFTADNIDPNTDSFTQGGSFTVVVEDPAVPDLKITKSANFPDSSSVALSDTLIYYLHIANIGDADAISVVLADTLAIPNIELVDAYTSAGECFDEGILIFCEIDEIVAGDTVLVTIETIAKIPGIIRNFADVESLNLEDNIENNTSNTITHTITEPLADIATSVFVVEPDSIPPNGFFSLQTVLANNGTHDAAQVAFQLLFDHPVRIQNFEFLSQDKIDCEEYSPLVSVSTFSCLAGILEADKAIIMSIAAVLDGDPAPSQYFTIRSQAAAQAPGDPDLSNNEAMTSIPISRHIGVTPPIPSVPPDPVIITNSTDLQVTNAFLMPPGPIFVPCLGFAVPAFLVGQNIIHTFTIKNNGPQEATAVRFRNLIAISSFYMDYDFNSLTEVMKPKCQLVPGMFGFSELRCNLGDMDAGESISFSIAAKARISGDPISNTAIVSSETFDHKPINNVAFNSVSIFKIVCPPLFGIDLAVEIADVTEMVEKLATESDSIRTVQVQFRNNGQAPAFHNMYVDTLPAAMRFVTMSLADTTDKTTRCVVDEVDDSGDLRHRLQCNWVRHNPGEVKTLYVKGKIIEMGHLDWYSRVRSSNWDSDLSNNIDSLKLDNLLGTSMNPDGVPEIPATTSLSQNFPNPFNPTTNITFTLAQSGNVRLDVFSVDGRLVTTIANGYRSAGNHAITIDASRLSSGVYLYRLTTATVVQTRKMAVIK